MTASFEEGLVPADYHPESLTRLLDVLDGRLQADPALRADLDILASDAAVVLAFHLFIGKVDPVSFDSSWNIDATVEQAGLSAHLDAIIESEDVEAYLKSLRPVQPLYQGLRAALADHRALAAAGGWGTLESGPTLREGDRDPRVTALRRRVDLSGAGGDVFDAELTEAVREFQRRHGLTDDGIVGAGTLAALNVTVEQRIDELRVNLERSRWVLHDVPTDFVLTNIAAFETFYFVDNELIWTARSQVGKKYRQTPVFRAEMKYLVLNPTWTVPPTVLAKDMLPKLKKDPGYLATKNMVVLDHSGELVDPQSVDWDRYSGSDFPYILRQKPGPSNALGLVKFIFPNPHFVFLHDTPSRSLFGRESRAFSSGCIRVDQPLDLTTLLLADQPDWPRSRIDAVIESEETATVRLTEPLPVILMYWTAYVLRDGTLHFRNDIYDRDPRVLAALDAPPAASRRKGGLLDDWGVGIPQSPSEH